MPSWMAVSRETCESGLCGPRTLYLSVALCLTFLRFCFFICKMTIMTVFFQTVIVKIKLENKVLITVPGP